MLFPRVRAHSVFLKVVPSSVVNTAVSGYCSGATWSTQIFASRIVKLCIGLQNQGLSKQLERVQD